MTRAEKEAELLALEQGACLYQRMRISSAAYLISLIICSKHKRGGRECLRKDSKLQFLRFVVSQRLHTLKKVVDSERRLESEDVATQRARETTSRALALEKKKGKGKRLFTSMGQGGPNTREFCRPSTCFNCGRSGHLGRDYRSQEVEEEEEVLA